MFNVCVGIDSLNIDTLQPNYTANSHIHYIKPDIMVWIRGLVSIEMDLEK